jgi:PHD/YefM family antitoxin component YafN of YafNO toxin-antitoxin module
MREVLMETLRERYVVDENGERVAVLLDIADYERVLEELEELESIRAYDAAKASGDESIPFEQAVAEIERDR